MRLGGPLVGGMPDGASNNAAVSGALWEKKKLQKLEVEMRRVIQVRLLSDVNLT